MSSEVKKDVLTLQQAGAVLELSPEAIRQRILKKQIRAKLDRGSPKLGYIIDRSEFVRYLRSIDENERADRLERGDTIPLPSKRTHVLN